MPKYLSYIVLTLVIAAHVGCDSTRGAASMGNQATTHLPAIDLEAPAEVETATFGLG